MNYPKVYLDYLYQFHVTRDYYECHEMLEVHWKQTSGQDAHFWQGLIMLATALYHERRGNKDGAAKMYSGALERLNKDTLYRYGIEAKTLLEAIRERIALPGNEFGDMDIELCDGTLAWMCHKETVKHGSKWGIASDLSDERLIHRHRYKKQK